MEGAKTPLKPQTNADVQDGNITNIIAELKQSSSEDSWQRIAVQLRNYVSNQSRELSAENFSRWMKAILKQYIFVFIDSGYSIDKMKGLVAITQLIGVTPPDVLNILVIYFRITLKSNDKEVINLSAKGLGIIWKNSENLSADLISFDTQQALEWLQFDRLEHRKHAACLIFTELAENAPSQFFSHVPAFLDLIWTVLRDTKPSIREEATTALGAVLKLISVRESKFRVPWYNKIYEEVQRGFGKQSSAEFLHASLLAVAELFTYTGDYMKDKYTEVFSFILKSKDVREKIIKKTITKLFPKLAAYQPDKFVASYLPECMNHIMNQFKKELKSTAFVAMGEIAVIVKDDFQPFLANCIAAIKATFEMKAKNTNSVKEAIVCVSLFAKAMGPGLEPALEQGGLLDHLFACGLSETLVESLSQIGKNVPNIAKKIQDRLLNLLSGVLAQKPFYYPGTPAKLRKRFETLNPKNQDWVVLLPKEEGELNKLLRLALETLEKYEFDSNTLIEFLKETVVKYLKSPFLPVRRAAASAGCKIVATTEAKPQGYSSMVVNEVLEELIAIGIVDSDPSIRHTVLNCLSDSRFDIHLAQASNLCSLLIALNDEVFEIREIALKIVCRLCVRNPAYILPSLRKTLMHLLKDVEDSSDNVVREQAAKLLTELVRMVPSLVKPYTEPLMKAILPKLRDPDSRVSSWILACVGELAVVSGVDMMDYVTSLMPLIIETLQDQSSPTKREVAVRVLSKLAESTGYVIAPLMTYPKLLETLLNLIQSETNRVMRMELIKLFGILGALDPYKHKMNQLALEGREAEEEGLGKTLKSDGKENADSIASLSPSNEDYYPTVTITALLKILKDPSLSFLFALVADVLMTIMQSLGIKSVQFLPLIMGPFLQVTRTCAPEFRVSMFRQLGRLVASVKQHIREYLKDIFKLVQEFWDKPNLVQIISLLEEISGALNDEFKPYIPQIIPKLLVVASGDFGPEPCLKSLSALEKFLNHLGDYLHLIIPILVKTAENVENPTKIRSHALSTLRVLCKVFNVVDHASRILHPLVRILDSPPANDIVKEAMKLLCVMVKQLGLDYLKFLPITDKVIAKNHISHAEYDTLVARLRTMPSDRLMLESENEFFVEPSSPSKSSEDMTPDISSLKKIKLNEQNLRRAWEVSQRSTKEDWAAWIKKFSLELIHESPSPALRACISLANEYHPIVKELFNAGFVLCWSELPEQYQDELIRSLEAALTSSTIPPEILQTLLNLAEYMEQYEYEKPLPIDFRILGQLAEKCHAFAKALHYKEIEFKRTPATTIEALISIYNQLQHPESALGVLAYARKHLGISLKEAWYEKLQRWQLALEAYEKKVEEDPNTLQVTKGKMRCLNALGEWEKLAKLSQQAWTKAKDPERGQIARLAASGAWNLGNWELMETYVTGIDEKTIEGGFYRAILAIHKNNFSDAQKLIDLTRELVDVKLAALVGESYGRAYKNIVRIQQLSELEEIIEFKKNPNRRDTIRKIWKQRLDGCERSIDTWQHILIVRSLVLSKLDDMDSWLKFSSLCRKSGRLDLAHKSIVSLLGTDPAVSHSLPTNNPRVSFAYTKLLWSRGGSQLQKSAFAQLKAITPYIKDDPQLLARAFHKLGEWQYKSDGLDTETISSILGFFSSATRHDPEWYKAWHAWALANFEAINYYEKINQPKKIGPFLVPAINGFFKSISLASANRAFQDTLRLITLWFKYGAIKEAEDVIAKGLKTINVDIWLLVIPQIIARLHTPVPSIKKSIQDLLVLVGQAHPQALVYSLMVSTKSQSTVRSAIAQSILEKIKQTSSYHASLVSEVSLVTDELIRVSILWHELWHEGLEEASRTFFEHHNTEGMIHILRALHNQVEKGPETMKEVAFYQGYGKDLQEAWEWCKRWEKSGKQSDLNQAWDLYGRVFRRIGKQLPQITSVELDQSSPKLLSAKEMNLAVPGTYKTGAGIVRISQFNPALNVISSKQRPRKLICQGSDGSAYKFLLKGHEDLRQDERVMQLFGLVNNLLAGEYETSKNHLSIQRFSVIPLSPNSGLIGWVPHCDTFHQLIRDYRDSRKILINIEHRLMLQFAPDYENSTVMQKVEAFEYALDNTNGQDLERILWLKSNNSEVWLDRRTNYTRSLALMSMVGYILGLGDRHPSNLMLDRHTGKVIHIDFGDCFEVAMQREKYPEKIPFRLTRMLVNAMEVCGVEGMFRHTCETVMKLLRKERESLMAVLEAFVYDPLINWRFSEAEEGQKSPKDSVNTSIVPPNLMYSSGPEVDYVPTEVLNKKAVSVINRVSAKLTGKDFGEQTLEIQDQVEKLIQQARMHENLCQCYVGWCPFW